MISYIYFVFLGFYLIATLFYVNDFKDSIERPYFVSLLLNSENNNLMKSKLSMLNSSEEKISNSGKDKLSHSAILRKLSEIEDSLEQNPLKVEPRSEEENEKNKTNEEIHENEIYELQDINVLESIEIIRNGKKSRV